MSAKMNYQCKVFFNKKELKVMSSLFLSPCFANFGVSVLQISQSALTSPVSPLFTRPVKSAFDKMMPKK